MKVLSIIFICFIVSFNFAYSEDEYRIVYAEGRSIKIINLKGNIKDKIDLPRNIVENFSFSRDKKILVYDGVSKGKKTDIFIYYVDKRKEEKLTHGPYVFKEYLYKPKDLYGEEMYSNPEISPDGRYVAFEYFPEFGWGVRGIDEEDMDENMKSALMKKEKIHENNRYYLYKKEGDQIFEYEIYPNDEVDIVEELREVGIIEIQYKKFFPVTRESEYISIGPTFSPDSKKIAFWLDVGYIAIFNLGKKQLFNTKVDGCPHKWIDNHTLLFFDVYGSFYLFDLILGEKILLIKEIDEEWIPWDISSDKKYIIFSKRESNGRFAIYLYNLEKKELKKIAETKESPIVKFYE
jgi:Tol biopolymer transport system component